MLGPPWWWADNGIDLQPGDPIELEGFESPDHMEVNWIKNLRTGQCIDLRTPSGMPVLIGVFLYREPFTFGRLFGFAIIWAAVGVFIFDNIRAQRGVPVL